MVLHGVIVDELPVSPSQKGESPHQVRLTPRPRLPSSAPFEPGPRRPTDDGTDQNQAGPELVGIRQLHRRRFACGSRRAVNVAEAVRVCSNSGGGGGDNRVGVRLGRPRAGVALPSKAIHDSSIQRSHAANVLSVLRKPEMELALPSTNDDARISGTTVRTNCAARAVPEAAVEHAAR